MLTVPNLKITGIPRQKPTIKWATISLGGDAGVLFLPGHNRSILALKVEDLNAFLLIGPSKVGSHQISGKRVELSQSRTLEVKSSGTADEEIAETGTGFAFHAVFNLCSQHPAFGILFYRV